jgi:hypothetical protein
MKANPGRLIRAHYATLVDNRTGRPRLSDHLVFEGIPAAVLIATWIAGVELSRGVTVGLLTVAGLMGAFFFGAMLQVSMRAMTWADQGPTPGPDVSRHATFLNQIAANAGYAALVCVLTATVFVVASVVKGTGHVIASAFGLALAVHLALMLLMVTVRIFALTQERLTDARTGHEGVARFPARKAG